MAYSTCHQEKYYEEAIIVAHGQAIPLKEREHARSPTSHLFNNIRPFKVKNRSTPVLPLTMPLREERIATKRSTNVERTSDPSER